ncbi:helix-turn-helix transcriptional regulator [Paenarthrobacter sp. Z7-10]|nr:helix-turn-helix transcriptional regulator [Paenarthrobacter sp. Z7-10]
MVLKFRNLDIDPTDPIDTWGVEGILAAIDRGDLRDWRRIGSRLRAQPRGKVAGDLQEVLSLVETPAMVNLFTDLLARAKSRQQQRERETVVGLLRSALQSSGLTRADFAARLGTSGSRLSTYLTGKVMPSATLLVRAANVAVRELEEATPPRPQG